MSWFDFGDLRSTLKVLTNATIIGAALFFAALDVAHFFKNSFCLKLNVTECPATFISLSVKQGTLRTILVELKVRTPTHYR